MFNKVLVAIDGSKMTDRVIKATKEFATTNQADITLIYVGKDLVIPPQVVITDYNHIISEVKNHGIQVLQDAQAQLEADGIKAGTLFVQGSSISRMIVSVATDHKHDLIIIGSRGLSNIKGMMLGGVSHKVTQLSQCPVLIVK